MDRKPIYSKKFSNTFSKPPTTSAKPPPSTTTSSTFTDPSDKDFYDSYYYYDDYNGEGDEFLDYLYSDNKFKDELKSKKPVSSSLGPLDPPSTSTSRPVFRFTPAADKKSPPPRKQSGGTIDLSDLIASLKDNVKKQHKAFTSTSTLDSDGAGRVLSSSVSQPKTTTPKTVSSSDSVSSSKDPKVQVSITNSTESTVVVASVQTSHSVSINKENSLSQTTPPIGHDIATSTEKIDFSLPLNKEIEQTSEVALNEENETSSKSSLTSLFENIDINGIQDEAGPRSPIPTENLPETTVEVEEKSEQTPFISSTTEQNLKIKNLIENIKIDDVSELLPPGYSSSFRPDTTSTTLKETSILSIFPGLSTTESNVEKENILPIIDVDVSKFLPPGYKEKIKTVDNKDFLPPGFTQTTKTIDNETIPPSLESEIKTVDASAFLPPGYKEKIKTVDASDFLPPGFADKIETVDVSAFLPPGFNDKIKTVDASDFLAPGISLSSTTSSSTKYTFKTTTEATTTTRAPRRTGIKFPNWGGKRKFQITTAKTKVPSTPGPVTREYINILDR